MSIQYDPLLFLELFYFTRGNFLNDNYFLKFSVHSIAVLAKVWYMFLVNDLPDLIYVLTSSVQFTCWISYVDVLKSDYWEQKKNWFMSYDGYNWVWTFNKVWSYFNHSHFLEFQSNLYSNIYWDCEVASQNSIFWICTLSDSLREISKN